MGYGILPNRRRSPVPSRLSYGGLGTSLALSENVMIGMKVFTATRARDRASLGDLVTRWLRENPEARITKTRVMQSSDAQFHCLTIILVYDIPQL